MTRRIAVTGSSGLIGSALVEHLRGRGDEVVRLVRRPPRDADERRWDPVSRRLDPAALDGVSAVVHLAGAGLGDHRWTPSYRSAILTSRTDSTHAVAAAVADADHAVRLVSGSAVGFYGDRGDEELTEDSAAGEGFLSEVVLAWEASAAPAVEAGASVAFSRTGIVLSPDGGAAAPLLRLARLGLGGPLGTGRQFWPWITLGDAVRGLVHLADSPDLTGPVNLVGPQPARQRDIARAFGTALHRPAVLAAPGFALHAVVGEFAGSILASQRVVGRRLPESGFEYAHPDLERAVAWVLGRDA